MRILLLCKNTYDEFAADNCPQLAAALAYYTVFSLPPLLVVVIGIAGLVFDPADVEGELKHQISLLFGSQRATQIQEILRRVDQPDTGHWQGILGAFLLLLGASGVLNELQRALNTVWDVEPDPKLGGVLNFVFKRFISFAMVMGIAFLLMVSLVISTLLSAAGERIASFLPGDISQSVLQTGNVAVSFAVIFILFMFMYRFLPDAKIRLRDVWQGALVATILFVVGKFVMGWYLGSRDIGSAYGTAGSLVVILMWVYYAAMTFYGGAEFSQVLKSHRGERVHPEKGAARVIKGKKHVKDSTRS